MYLSEFNIQGLDIDHVILFFFIKHLTTTESCHDLVPSSYVQHCENNQRYFELKFRKAFLN